MPNPGPTLLIVAATALIEVIKSEPDAANIRVLIIVIAIYITKKPLTLSNIFSSIILSENLTSEIAFGCKSLFNSLYANLKSNITLITFKPPAVEPEEPPINIKIIRITFEEVDHFSKSAVAKPVVVMIEVT